jgi:cell pole-organizing protein PopZ
MEDILASIRRIIADDDATKTAKPPEPAPVKPPVASAPMRPAPPPRAPVPPPPRPMPAPAPAAKNNQDDIDAMLADVETLPKAAPAAPPPDVFDLTEAMATQTPPPGPAPSFRTIDGASDVVFTDRPPEPPAEPAVRSTVDEARRQFANATPDRSLLSSTASAAVDGAFNSLAHTVLVQNARTLEDLVKEMLRPMLKAWLDDNLPNMVDRIVRAEIERVSRGR